MRVQALHYVVCCLLRYMMAAFLVILFQLLLLCLRHVSPCVSLQLSLQSTSTNINRKSPIGFLRSCRQRLFPSSTTTSDTHSLALLFEAYDVIQDPSFRSTSTNTAWKIFDGIVSDVEATTEGVVAGQGLVAKRAFQAGEVVALYPIHALGYANARRTVPHEPSLRRHPSPRMAFAKSMEFPADQEQAGNIIVGTSDLVCFKDEARQFGVTATATRTEEDDDGNSSTSIQPQLPVPVVDYTYTMLDPSERYVFDVNPSRTVSSSMFVAHLVNDAAAADFSFSSATFDFDETVGTAVAYLEESLANFNVVMTPFGPPPLMAYVTVKPVEAGTELLATYGLDYWLGKGDDDDNDNEEEDVQEALRRRLENVPRVRQGIDRADDIVAAALKVAKAAVRSSGYKTHTGLMGRAVADLMAVEVVPAPQGNINRSRWWRRILPK
jgi:hypothetical protein